MNNCLFSIRFLEVACTLRLFFKSQNNKNRPNKNNDVITDLGGGGNFPMFLSSSLIYARLIHGRVDRNTYPRTRPTGRNDYPLPCTQWTVGT